MWFLGAWKSCLLWVALFPSQGILDGTGVEKSGWALTRINSLLSPDCGCSLISFFKLLLALVSCPRWTVPGDCEQVGTFSPVSCHHRTVFSWPQGEEPLRQPWRQTHLLISKKQMTQVEDKPWVDDSKPWAMGAGARGKA